MHLSFTLKTFYFLLFLHFAPFFQIESSISLLFPSFLFFFILHDSISFYKKKLCFSKKCVFQKKKSQITFLSSFYSFPFIFKKPFFSSSLLFHSLTYVEHSIEQNSTDSFFYEVFKNIIEFFRSFLIFLHFVRIFYF